MGVKTYPKANFVQMVSYWQEHTDFAKLEEDKMTEVYFAGMEYFGRIAGKAGKVDLFPRDMELLLLMSGDKHLTIDELTEQFAANAQSLSKLVYKLVIRGYVSSYKEKNKNYYRLTPYGQKALIDEILNKK